MDMNKIKEYIDKILVFVKNHKKLSIVIFVIVLSMFSGNSDDNNTSSTNSNNKNVVQNDEFNLSLGELKLGNTPEEVKIILGTNFKEATGYKRITYKYNDIDVIFRNNVVQELSSHTNNIQTEKGIKQGTSLQQVISTYGKECSVNIDDELTLYEYLFQSQEGRNAVIRFATRNNFVDYINLKIIDDSEKDKILSNVQTVDYEKPHAIAKKILLSYYDNIIERKWRNSYYNYFNDDLKNSINFNDWSNQFYGIVDIKLSDINVESESPNSVTFNYKLTAITKSDLTNEVDAHATITNGDKGWKITDITNETLAPPKKSPKDRDSVESGTSNNNVSPNNLKSIGLTLDQFVSRYNDAIAGRTWNGMGTISNVQFGANNEAEVKLTENIAITFVKASSDSNELGGIVLAAEHFTNGMSRGEDMTLEEVMRAMISGIAPDVNTTAFVNDLMLILIQGGTKQLGGKTLICKPDEEGDFCIVVLKQK